MLPGQFIEGAKEFIENGDGDVRGLRGGPLGESDHVSEKHADVVEPIGDRVLLAFESLSDLQRKHIFGWTFEDAMPPGAPGRYLIARLDGKDVCAITGPGKDAAAWRTCRS